MTFPYMSSPTIAVNLEVFQSFQLTKMPFIYPLPGEFEAYAVAMFFLGDSFSPLKTEAFPKGRQPSIFIHFQFKKTVKQLICVDHR